MQQDTRARVEAFGSCLDNKRDGIVERRALAVVEFKLVMFGIIEHFGECLHLNFQANMFCLFVFTVKKGKGAVLYIYTYLTCIFIQTSTYH